MSARNLSVVLCAFDWRGLGFHQLSSNDFMGFLPVGARVLHYGSYIKGLSAYDRHKKFMDDYVHLYPGSTSSVPSVPVKTDMDTLRETYRFIRTDEDDAERTWEQRLAKRYYDKLFKEYPHQHVNFP
ncbi:hypothetical protein AXG93_2550s1140 [Marchantia polymorpha subsp. ruderalis]|uniref:Uncharacterized protein n=1 Tax=Marchantia polymorpha subsp. ruderalis TaxID=1480154 RepID=A0A176VME8_MARPO|nr:hypothetical protein AXG93_2550s1140 [Marchantia polymorpha subsp. ruderalis]